MRLSQCVLLILLTSLLFTQCTEEFPSPESNYSDLSNYKSGITSFGSGNQNPEGGNFAAIEENPFIKTSEEPISTFSIDADGASYTVARRFLNDDRLPPVNAIRTEELVNYFNYSYPEGTSDDPITVSSEIAKCPWNSNHRLLRIGLKGKSIPEHALPPSNFVLLIDVSGSMSSHDKLELLKQSFNRFVDEMDTEDKLAIVTYAGSAGVVLESTSGAQKQVIREAIGRLGAGGSTAGAEGIITAYQIAEENFIPEGNNRIILGTDGDFNVGISDTEELVKLIEEKREKGIFLTVLGVGLGNLNDHMLEQIADNGNGNYEYIDNIQQAEKVFINEYSKFFTVAKDVKIQIEFKPTIVAEYRLIGYENRLLETEDFEDDTKDAGEIGAGQSITALYELIPAAGERFGPAIEIDFRYKLPDADQSKHFITNVSDTGKPFESASPDTRFAASVAAYGLLLRDSKYKGSATFEDVLKWADQSGAFDPFGYKSEFLNLVVQAQSLK